jgi:thiosulfate dehydrogenase
MTLRRAGLWIGLALGAALRIITALHAQSPPSAWNVPDVQALPPGAWRETVLYGRLLFSDTATIIGPEVRYSSMRFAGNNLSCQSCHLQGGTQQYSIPMIGVYALFPMFIARENEVRTIEDRIEGCMERSMNGRALPIDGKEMKALVAYIQFLSTGVPIGKTLEGRGSPALPLLDRAASPDRGAEVYAQRCVACHQAEGQGIRKGPIGDATGYLYPPLWGPDSFNDGAGMHRLIAAASFIRGNMPLGTKYDMPMLSVDDAWDVAAYINTRPRPARDHLDRDYPDRSRKPIDAPFPPFADGFPQAQHQFGPFRPIRDAQAGRVPPK